MVDQTMTEPDLFGWVPPATYPLSPGWKEPTTSRDAAAKVAPVARTVRDQVLLALRVAYPGGLTADEAAAKVGRTILAVRPRISELRDLGAIQPSQARRPNDSGLRAIVWVALRSCGDWQ